MEYTDSSIPSQPIVQPASLDSPFEKALMELKAGLLNWRVWYMLSWQDIRLRYRRSMLGPFWITISMAISIYSMGFLYSHLFHWDLHHYYPFLAAGMLTWNLINTLITESTNAFIEAENYLKQIKLPYMLFVMRIVFRSLLIFTHNIVVIIPIILFLHVPLDLDSLLFFPGLFLILLNGLGFGFVLAMLGVRFRDVTQIITSLTQVAFFLTPVIWDHRVLSPHLQWIVKLNPFAEFLELLRAPLMGNAPTAYTYVFTATLTLVGLLIAFLTFVKVRHRIVYWL